MMRMSFKVRLETEERIFYEFCKPRVDSLDFIPLRIKQEATVRLKRYLICIFRSSFFVVYGK